MGTDGTNVKLHSKPLASAPSRPLVATEAFSGADDNHVDTRHDARRRVLRRSAPHFENDTAPNTAYRYMAQLRLGQHRLGLVEHCRVVRPSLGRRAGALCGLAHPGQSTWTTT